MKPHFILEKESGQNKSQETQMNVINDRVELNVTDYRNNKKNNQEINQDLSRKFQEGN